MLFQSAFCQENYQAGYIIRLNGDTLQGLINYRGWVQNPKKISFKVKLTDNISVLTPPMIKGFGILGENYESAIVESDYSPDITVDLERNNESTIIDDTTFLKTMFRGPKSIYYFKNKYDKIQFYIWQNDKYELLLHKESLQHQEEGGTAIVENKKYLGQLTYYLQDCPAIVSKLESTTYTWESMLSLFHYYYDKTNKTVQYQKATPKLKIEWGAVAGVSQTSLYFIYNYVNDAMAGTKYNPSVNAAYGAYLDLVFPGNFNNWSLHNELFNTSYKVSGTYNTDPLINTVYSVYTSFQFSYIKLNSLFRYKLPFKGRHLFIESGISYGMAIQEHKWVRSYEKTLGIVKVTESPSLLFTRNSEKGFLLGFGANIKKCTLDFRYEIGNGMSPKVLTTNRTRRLFFMISYKIN